ncbi:hypothetical protein UFOVP777_5 [uncultured Caudovirales phage]|uniref:Major capsid protein n=1 Tax=uncultured Caudovirales phage TaxID=2100421 RepID=A0A6J5NPT3_9CAUD|nr:hypothetical protein UFOVP777_5 [uncultured Caudovirales phage]
MAASMSTLEAALKEFYIAPIQDQLNNEIELFKYFGTAEATIDASGKFGIIPVRLGRNSGVGARAAGKNLPTAGNQVLDKLTIQYKFVYGRFAFDGPSLAAAKKSAGAFGTVTEIEMDNLVLDVKNYANMVGFLGGQYIGLIIDKLTNGAGGALVYSGRWADIAFGGGETFDVVNLVTMATVAGPYALTAISATAITTNTATAFAALTPGTPLGVRLNCVNPLNENILSEPTGLLGNLIAISHHGLDRSVAANASLISNYRIMNAGAVYAALDLDDMQRMFDTSGDRSGMDPDMIQMQTVHRQSYTSLLQGTSAGNLFVNPKEKAAKVDAGFRAGSLAFNDVPLGVSKDCPKGTIFFLNSKTWKRVELQAGGFAEEDGKILNKVPNQDAYEGFWRMYYEQVCMKPNASSILTGVQFT